MEKKQPGLSIAVPATPAESSPPGTPCGTSSSHEAGMFDCNICLDCASDPVITVCGHLYWCARARAAGPARAGNPVLPALACLRTTLPALY